MTNPNPFVPKGSLLEQQSASRSRLKLAVFCVLAISVTGLTAMLIQGCKREKPDTDLNPPTVDTNAVAMDTNVPPIEASNPPVVMPPVVTNPPVVTPPVVTPPVVTPDVAPVGGSEYVVVKGDSLAKIAKKNGVTLKALQAANPGVIPTKLKVGQKLVIPAGGKAAADSAAPAVSAGGDVGTASYTVKSGDTLTKIAKAHGTTVKAIEAANGLSTTKIKVGQKLKIPAKAEAAAPAAPAPVAAEPAPALPPISAPAAASAPAK
jgi:LysM repeat protein